MKEKYEKPGILTETVFEAKTGGIELFGRCWGISFGNGSHQRPNCKE